MYINTCIHVYMYICIYRTWYMEMLRCFSCNCQKRTSFSCPLFFPQLRACCAEWTRFWGSATQRLGAGFSSNHVMVLVFFVEKYLSYIYIYIIHIYIYIYIYIYYICICIFLLYIYIFVLIQIYVYMYIYIYICFFAITRINHSNCLSRPAMLQLSPVLAQAALAKSAEAVGGKVGDRSDRTKLM